MRYEIMSVIIGGIYEHYKGNKYKVIGVGKHSETLEKLIIYQALYGNNELWVRPYDMFCEKIVKDGKEIHRFRYMGDELDLTYTIQLDISEELNKVLFENNIDIGKEISQYIENVNVEYKPIDAKNHKKDIGLIILASGVSVSAILLCISKIIRTVSERPREVKVIEKNEDGIILKEETVLLEPNKASQKTEIDFELGTKSIKFKILDENN